MRHGRDTRAGFSLVEVVIASAIFGGLLTLSLMAFSRNQRQVNESMVIATVSQIANLVEARIQEQLRSAGELQLVDTNGDTRYDRVNFRPVTGYDFAAGRAQLSTTGRALRWLNDGADGDKITNDGFLELINTGNPTSNPPYVYGTATVRVASWGSDVLWQATTSRMDFYGPNATTASTGATPAATDTELRIAFTVEGVVGANSNGSLARKDERRVVRISLRNLPPA